MADYDASGGSEPVEGLARSPEDVSAPEILAGQVSPSRPEWMMTRFPVDMEEYRRLSIEAQAPQMEALSPNEHAMEDPGAQSGVEEADIELPEDFAATDPMAPTLSANFAGIPQTQFQPPDCTVGVGPQHVLASVNADLACYTKAGAQLFRIPLTAFFAPVLQNAVIFDPRVAYDHYAGRYIVVATARINAPAASFLTVAVSQTSNPQGAYWMWALNARLDGSTLTNNWADYPMLGFDTQAIYISSNMFAFNGGFQYVKLRILNKAELYAGGVGPAHAVRWYDFWGLRNTDNSLAFTVQPAVHFRGVGGNPPAYLINAIWPEASVLTKWTLTNPLAFWTGGGAPGLSRVSIACMAYALPPDALQRGSTTRIETNDSRLLNAIYQNAGGVQRIWTCQTGRHTWGGDSEARSVVQWYEIDVPTNRVIQQSRFGASGLYYYFPAIQTDINRRGFVVFGRSGGAEFAQLRQSGRRVADPQNTLQGSALIQQGLSAYTGGRWGDYFGICRDGANAGVVWMYGENAAAGNTWGTRIASVFLPAPLTPVPSGPSTNELEDLRRSIQDLTRVTMAEAPVAGAPARGKK
jgi:hypothetical protein